MKKFKVSFILFLIFICLLITAVCYTIAWFAVNSKVNEEGITIKSEVTPNLVISDVSSSIKTLNTDDSPFSVSKTFNSANKFLPCTHGIVDSSKNDTNLKYLTNTGDVGTSTGLATNESFADVINSGSNKNSEYFYVDYVVYIASTGTSFTGDLSASFGTDCCYVDALESLAPSPTTGASYSTFQAASIDFYVDGNYADTLNIAGKKNSSTGVTQKNTAYLITNGTIPLNTSSEKNYITITMRCYYDGALLESVGQAYVNTDTVTSYYAKLNVIFTATESTSS